MIRVSRRRSCLVVRAGDGTREVDLKVVVGKVALEGERRESAKRQSTEQSIKSTMRCSRREKGRSEM